MDFAQGREGGTWLAMNTNGKVAALLNVLRPRVYEVEKRRPRGKSLCFYYYLNIFW